MVEEDKNATDLEQFKIDKRRVTVKRSRTRLSARQACSPSAPRVLTNRLSSSKSELGEVQRRGGRRVLIRRRRRRRIRRVRQAAVLTSIVFLVGGLYLYRGGISSKRQVGSSDKKNMVVVSPTQGKRDDNEREASRKKEASGRKITPIFGKVPSLNLTLYFLADYPEFVGVGFHQASNPKTLPLDPYEPCLRDQTEETVRNAVSEQDAPIYFIMASRGRGKHLSSAADIALVSDTKLRSPVDGVVTRSEPYSLYGRYDDWRLEIAPRGYSEMRVVMIHLDEVPLKMGDKVYHRKTVIGKPKALRGVINSQINRYIPYECEHVHLQVNPYEPDPPTSEAGQPPS